jgi:hypothetical protein
MTEVTEHKDLATAGIDTKRNFSILSFALELLKCFRFRRNRFYFADSSWWTWFAETVAETTRIYDCGDKVVGQR